MADPSSPDDPTELAHLRELGLRLLARHRNPAELSNAKLLVGRLPPELPVELPMPPGARLLGSYICKDARGHPTIQICLDAIMRQQDLLAFYDQQLQQHGWSIKAVPNMMSVLLGRASEIFETPHPDEFTTTRVYRSAGDWVELRVTVPESDGEIFAVWLELNATRTPALPSPYRIPTLKPPPDTQQWGGGGGGSDDSRSHTRTVISRSETMDHIRIAEHYAQELSAAGWSLAFQQAHELAAISEWRFETVAGEPWEGRLTVLRDEMDAKSASHELHPGVFGKPIYILRLEAWRAIGPAMENISREGDNNG